VTGRNIADLRALADPAHASFAGRSTGRPLAWPAAHAAHRRRSQPSTVGGLSASGQKSAVGGQEPVVRGEG
jgi:hypothetical protein